ncbi:protein MMS22-like isoform X2 [Anneissia japonica]|uniref:protein MMS22-like isoform X2 n=1 Tax=Anneissia japonica TaxID=1529436 RepID=UPI001425B9EA|nr:protein MMS22-like isoform X2 [Anneissia japonica]
MDNCIGIVEGSMTPPISPRHLECWYDDLVDESLLIHHDELLVGDVAPSCIFTDCSDADSAYNSEWKACNTGHLHCQVLAKILSSLDPHPSLFQDTKCKLFGSHFVTSSGLLDSTCLIFSLAKQKIGKLKLSLEMLAHKTSTDSDISDSASLKHTCVVFLQYLKVFIHRHYKFDETSGCRYNQRLNNLHPILLQEMEGLSNYLGKVADLPSNVLSQYISSGLKKQSIAYLVLHIVLNVRWGLIESLHMLYSKTKGTIAENDVNNLLTAEVNIFINDIVYIARLRFNSISRKDLKNVSPFPCPCLQEFVIMLIHFLDQRQSKFGTESFWFMFHAALEANAGLNKKGNIDLCWWLLIHISPLYKYNQNGELQKSSTCVRSNWLMVGDLLKMTFSQELGLDEECIRVHLQCCLSLCHVWEPSSKTLATLWQYSHKRMNQALLKTERSLDGLASISKSALGWFDQTKQRAADHTASQDSDNSFHLFLRIIAVQFGKMEGTEKLQGWKQLKGRLYSKFHSRSMQELNNNGLSHFISLFLVLAQTVDLSDASHKMLDLLDMLSTNSISQSKQLLIWKGLFTLCLVHQEKQKDISFITEKLVSAFDNVCSEFCHKDNDLSQHHHLWTLITLYTDATQDVFDNSSNNLCLSEEKLIGSGFCHLFPACNESELRTMLQFTLNLMACQRNVYRRLCQSAGSNLLTQEQPKINLLQQQADLVQRLWTNFFPFVKSTSANPKPSCLLADVAASFTMLASDMEENSTEPPEKVLDIFNYFGVSDTTVHSSISMRYLCHILPNAALMQKIENHHGTGYEAAVIHAWVRCSILSNQKADEQQEFTRLIYKIPSMAAMVEDRGQLNTNVPEFAQFVRYLGQRFTSAQNLQEKILFRKNTLQVFGDLVKLIQFALKKFNAAGGELKWLYQTIGYTVRYCAPVLYVQSKPHQSQLPGLLSELLLPPLIFNPNKTLPTNMLNAIKETLHLFLEGLSTLDFQKDGFIRQKMQEIIQQYFVRFATKCSIMANSNSVTVNHPLLF